MKDKKIYLAVIMLLVLTIVSACGSTEQTNVKIENSGDKTNVSNPAISPTPAISENMPLYSTDDLFNYIQKNKSEFDKMNTGKTITVAGFVSLAIGDEVTIKGNNRTTVRCSSYDFAKSDNFNRLAALTKDYENGKSSKMPLATVKGVYTASTVPNGNDTQTTVMMDNCEVLTAPKQ